MILNILFLRTIAPNQSTAADTSTSVPSELQGKIVWLSSLLFGSLETTPHSCKLLLTIATLPLVLIGIGLASTPPLLNINKHCSRVFHRWLTLEDFTAFTACYQGGFCVVLAYVCTDSPMATHELPLPAPRYSFDREELIRIRNLKLLTSNRD